MTKIGRVALVAAGALLVSGTAWGAPQGKYQQKCINKVNKKGIKVQAAQGKENKECVKRYANGELGVGPTVGEDCLTADPKAKVAKKMGKTVEHDNKFCVPLGVPPAFGYPVGTGAATINAAAQNAELEMMHDIFGDPVDDGLWPCDPNLFECRCQRKMINRIEKMMQTLGRVFVKCKKNALKVEKLPFISGAASAADLEDCLTGPANGQAVAEDPKFKISKRLTNISDTITKQCQGPMVEDPFPAGCFGLNNDALRDCLMDIIECRFCEMVNTMDVLAVDCDAFAGVVSCP